MTIHHRALALVTLALALFLSCSVQLSAYVEAPMSLGAVIAQSSNIVVMKVEKVDKEKNLILFRKVQDLKGKHPTEVIKHNIGRGGFHPREWQCIMEWGQAGKTAVFFHNGGASETCIGNYWYQAYAGGEWWNMSHGEPYLLRSFAGSPDKLAAAVTAMLAGQEVVVPCFLDGDKNTLQLRTAKVQRLKASLKLQDYNPKRDFVGWGGEDFRAIAGMPGFTHYAGLTRVDPGAIGVSAADFDGDGKADLCLFGTGKVSLLQNAGTSLNDASLPYSGGARAVIWFDANGDGKIDLFLATPGGPKLFTNQGGSFKDESALLPSEPYYNLTAAAVMDYDGDGKPDLLLANGFLGLRLYRNLGKVEAKAPVANAPGSPRLFEDISTKVGLGPDGIGGQQKGDHLAVADVNGDGRPDFLYCAGNGLMVLNTPQGFRISDSGVSFKAGKVTPVFGDFNGDKHIDLFVPQEGGGKLFQNDGKGRFTNVTAMAGDLAKPFGHATCAVWADMDRNGRLDLLIGCLKGPNRYFRNQGNGVFEDASEELGLHQRVFNTRGIIAIDLNKDKALDLVFVNEGQEPAVLLGNPQRLLAAKESK
jgi:hypothetical protein